MKFLSMLFSLERRHRFGVRAFQKGGVGIRLATLLMYAVFFGGTLGLEYWAISVMLSGEAVGVLLFILALLVGLAAFEFCASYSYVGFRMFFRAASASSPITSIRSTAFRTNSLKPAAPSIWSSAYSASSPLSR